MRYLIRRLKRVMPNATFVACFWMLGTDETKRDEWRSAVGADFACVSLSEATAICVRKASEQMAEDPQVRDHHDAVAVTAVATKT